MTLEQKAQAQCEEIRKELTPEMRIKLDQAMKSIADQKIEERCLKVGDRLPDVTLKNRDGEDVRLHDLLKSGPMVIGFFRGRWDPVCVSELKLFQEFLPQIKQAGLRLVFISPQTLEETACTVDQHRLTYTLLSDPGNRAAEAFGLAYTAPEEMITVLQYLGVSLPKSNGDDSWRLPVPAMFLVDKDGGVDYCYANADPAKRSEPEQVIHQVHEMQKKMGVMF